MGNDMEVPSDFFCEELRNDYKVSTKIKKIWAVQLDLLHALSSVCEKYNLKYFCAFGTLLGAVRHKGYIPWDDDFDVIMLRKDYDILLSHQNDFQYPYFLQNNENEPNCFQTNIRLRRSDTTGSIVGQRDGITNNGIFIDIYVLDDVDLVQTKYKFRVSIINALSHILACYKLHLSEACGLKKYIASIIQPIIRIVMDFDRAEELRNRLIAKKVEESSKVSIIASDPWKMYEKEWFDNSEMCQFEFLKLPIPANYDEILTMLYGEWRMFPPIEQRGLWHGDCIYYDPEMPYEVYIKGKGE